MAPSHKTGGKSAASRLTLTVVVELLNAARAASTVRVILPSVLFLRATYLFFIIYNTEPQCLRIINNNGICGTQEKEIKGGPAVGQPRLRRLAHGCRGIP